MPRFAHPRRLWLLIVLVALLALPAGPSPVAHAVSERPIMAFYYPWWDQKDWTYDKMSDLPAPKYSSGDDETLNRHIQQADDAGIDALICTWFGPDEPRLNKNCLRMMELSAASGRDLQFAIIPDHAAWSSLKSVDGMVNALNALQRDFMSKPNYLKFQGKPVVVWFRPEDLGSVDSWKQIRQRSDANNQMFWFGGTDQFNYLDVFDAVYYFDITWERSTGAAMASYANRLANYNRSKGTNKPFIATVMPGYDDIKYRNGHQKDRQNGEYYRGTWQTAISRNANAVILTSFNEFYEGSHIEPSEKYGDTYLKLTKEWSDTFRAQVGNAPAQPQPQPQPAPTTGPCQTFPETGFTACGRILQYWQQNGGLPVFGYPITDQHEEIIEGKPFQVQWFERNRLELHPENKAPYDVLLGRLGVDRLVQTGRDWQQFPKVASAPGNNCYFSDKTGHATCDAFFNYFRAHGLNLDARAGYSEAESLALFGLPLSEPQMEVNVADGKQYLTQWFERARFEYHPEVQGTNKVLLGLLGNEIRAGNT